MVRFYAFVGQKGIVPADWQSASLKERISVIAD
jgi:hypothetical protein